MRVVSGKGQSVDREEKEKVAETKTVVYVLCTSECTKVANLPKVVKESSKESLSRKLINNKVAAETVLRSWRVGELQ